jgi:hypothetical protein
MSKGCIVVGSNPTLAAIKITTNNIMTQTTILIGLFICHFLADYTHLSTAWMLNAKRLGTPLFPIFMHAFVHMFIMGAFLSVIGLKDELYFLMPFQLITHFLIDVWKGKMNSWFPSLQSPANKWHWVVFGFDQLLHALVIILMSLYITI